eukprot:jgi/Mesvir1/8771/Mv02685-RA.3
MALPHQSSALIRGLIIIGVLACSHVSLGQGPGTYNPTEETGVDASAYPSLGAHHENAALFNSDTKPGAPSPQQQAQPVKATCRDNCNGRGQCVQGICICNTGFEGDVCQKELPHVAKSYPGLPGPDPGSFATEPTALGAASRPGSPAADAGVPVADAREAATRQQQQRQQQQQQQQQQHQEQAVGPLHEAPGEVEGGDVRKLKVCLVTCEVVGPVNNGGIGTAFTEMAYSLRRRGHQVTILFTEGPVSQKGPFQDWVDHYAGAGIELVGLYHPPIRYLPRHMLASYEVLRFLRSREYDVIHFHDYQGAGYYSLLAKWQGLALQTSVTLVGVHGPTLWAKALGNQEPINKIGDLEMDYMERRSVALADYVVSPSNYILQWMDKEGWQMNPHSFVQPNLLPLAERQNASSLAALRTTSSTSSFSAEATAAVATGAAAGVAAGAAAAAAMATSDVGGVHEDARESGAQDTKELVVREREDATGGTQPARAIVTGLTELVYFGRLETRKGVIMFCDAVERLLAVPTDVDAAAEAAMPPETRRLILARRNLQRVTFLGRGAMVDGKFGVQYVQERAQGWDVPWKVISRMGPREAKEYLLEGKRLAIMPSRIENSPYTVYECAEMGIPFIASAVGGVADLVLAEDHPHALFPPTLEALFERLVTALTTGVRPARPSVDAHRNEATWMAFHTFLAQQRDAQLKERAEAQQRRTYEEQFPFVTVIMTHFNRPVLVQQAIQSLREQNYPHDRFEFLLIDDGSTDKDVPPVLDALEPEFGLRGWTILRESNRYLGAARNTAFRQAKGKYVLFMDDDNYAKPGEISTFVTAMEASGADVLTSFVDFFWSLGVPQNKSEDRPSYMFLGGSADVGAFKNCFGDANCFVRASSFREIGGYTEDYGVGFEDWEMYANASLRGFQRPRAVLRATCLCNRIHASNNARGRRPTSQSGHSGRASCRHPSHTW